MNAIKVWHPSGPGGNPLDSVICMDADQFEAIRARVGRLEWALNLLVSEDFHGLDRDREKLEWVCSYCHNRQSMIEDDEPFPHKPDCAISQGRDVLAEVTP